MQKFYKKVVQYWGYDGLDMVVIREERGRRKGRKGRFAINAKPNPYTTPITPHNTISPSLRTKAEKGRRNEDEERDGKGGR